MGPTEETTDESRSQIRGGKQPPTAPSVAGQGDVVELQSLEAENDVLTLQGSSSGAAV